MRSTFKVLFYLKRNAVRKSGCMPIIARITINGVIAQFSTKLEIHPDKWSVTLGEAKGQSKENKQITALLYDIKASIHQIYYELQRKYNAVTPEMIKNEFLGQSKITKHY